MRSISSRRQVNNLWSAKAIEFSAIYIAFCLAQLFFGEGKSSDAHVHLERAKSHAVNDPYILARASRLRARFWYEQHMFEEARSEALRALNVFEKLGASDDVEETRELLGDIDHELVEMDLDLVPPDESDDDGEFLEATLFIVSINSPCSDSVTDLSPGPNGDSDVRFDTPLRELRKPCIYSRIPYILHSHDA